MSIQIGLGLSTQRDPILAAKEAVIKARTDIYNAKISLALVFSSIDLSGSTTLKVIANFIEGAQILGISTTAIFSNQGLFKHGLAVMLISLKDDTYITTACVKNIKEAAPSAAGEELANNLLAGLKGSPRGLSLMFSEGLTKHGSEITGAFQKKLGASIPLLGAMTSSNLSSQETYIYSNQELLRNATAGLLFGGKLVFGLGTQHGWMPIGKPHRVTNSSGNIVNEIDGLPASKLYEDYTGKNITQLKEELRRISIYYPLGIRLEGEKEFLLRNVLEIKENGSLIFQGDIAQDSSIRIMIGTKETCLAAASQAVEQAKKALGEHPCKFALVFSSLSRYILLGRHAKKELDIIKEKLGENVPIVGIYTHAEQAPLKATSYLGNAYLHNQTINVLTIGG